ILNYGRIWNNVRLQDAKSQELVATYQKQALTAAQEVQTALRSFLRSQEQAGHLTRGVASARGPTKIQEKLFTDVKADVNRLFTLQNTQLQLQDQLAVAQGNIALNLINVFRALGGGWEVWGRTDACGMGPVVSPAPADIPPVRRPDQLPAPKTLP